MFGAHTNITEPVTEETLMGWVVCEPKLIQGCESIFQFATHFLSRQHSGAKILNDSAMYLLMMTGSPIAIQTKTSHKNQPQNHSPHLSSSSKKQHQREMIFPYSPYALHEPHPFLSNCFIHPQRRQEDTREHSVPMEIVTSPSPSSLETSEVKRFFGWNKNGWNYGETLKMETLQGSTVTHPTNGKGNSSSQLSLDESMFSFWEGTRLGTSIATF